MLEQNQEDEEDGHSFDSQEQLDYHPKQNLVYKYRKVEADSEGPQQMVGVL